LLRAVSLVINSNDCLSLNISAVLSIIYPRSRCGFNQKIFETPVPFFLPAVGVSPRDADDGVVGQAG
jgi:hypothetical protein